MERILTQDDALGVREHFGYDDASDTVTVRRTQDVEGVLDAVHAEHVETGGNMIDGVGRKVGEIPMVVLIDYCAARGIPWERMAYGSEYDDELKRLIRTYTKLSPSGGRI